MTALHFSGGVENPGFVTAKRKKDATDRQPAAAVSSKSRLVRYQLLVLCGEILWKLQAATERKEKSFMPLSTMYWRAPGLECELD
jgi:hypothetical protein